ncbi:tetratricopeptide repeat protein [Streptomyces sp. NPDC093795]|uniref:tetratricopeptide repeat protein n=1 Tax=Streptomyces sp. NPDC093795 TaxID=3366051 RepID=UPI00380CAB13
MRSPPRTEDFFSLAVGLRVRGDVLRKARRPAEAAEAYRRACAEQERLGDTYGSSITLTALGDTLAELGQHGEARACWERALPAMERARDPRRAGKLRRRLGGTGSGSGSSASAPDEGAA